MSLLLHVNRKKKAICLLIYLLHKHNVQMQGIKSLAYQNLTKEANSFLPIYHHICRFLSHP